VRMRDPARSPCKVGKMEEGEGMLMWPLSPCLMLHITRCRINKNSGSSLFNLNGSNVPLRYGS
jgi:hypothetical protein